jgi:hypothetical protein
MSHSRGRRVLKIRIDLPVFSSETEFYGLVSGMMEITNLPQPQTHFPWPEGVYACAARYLTPQNSLVWSINS